MKKIINDKEYDTDTAEMITELDCGDAFEELFKTPAGEFFLHMTYKGFGNEYIIAPLTARDVYEWAEGSENEDTYRAVTEAFSEEHRRAANIAHQFAQWDSERQIEFLDYLINSGLSVAEERKQELMNMRQKINMQMEIDKVNAYTSGQANAGRN